MSTFFMIYKFCSLMRQRYNELELNFVCYFTFETKKDYLLIKMNIDIANQ